MSKLILVKGAGDIATGVIQALVRSGHKVIATEIEKPSAIRRTVSLSDAVYKGEVQVEDIWAKFVPQEEFSLAILQELWRDHVVAITNLECSEVIKMVCPEVVIDAIISKKNIAKTSLRDADFVIGLGPGFIADYRGENPAANCHVAIETMRGHNLGRLILEGKPIPNTGIPGVIQGYSSERVLYAPCSGIFKPVLSIGDRVREQDVVAHIEHNGSIHPLYAGISGIIRGLLPTDFEVFKGMKSGDIDPRHEEYDNCFTISDKARALGGSVLQAIGLRFNY